MPLVSTFSSALPPLLNFSIFCFVFLPLPPFTDFTLFLPNLFWLNFAFFSQSLSSFSIFHLFNISFQVYRIHNLGIIPTFSEKYFPVKSFQGMDDWRHFSRLFVLFNLSSFQPFLPSISHSQPIGFNLLSVKVFPCKNLFFSMDG